MIRIQASVLSILAATALSGGPLRAQAPGVYSDSQATRGQQWYEATCQACHPTRDMSSTDFKLRWNGRTAYDLFARISNTMPPGDPGSLSRRTYIDVVAYLMRINGLPAGTTVMNADTTALRLITIAFPGIPAVPSRPR